MATAEFTVTREELIAELDRMAQEKLGISAAQFIERYNAGELDNDSPVVQDLALFARLIRDAPQSS